MKLQLLDILRDAKEMYDEQDNLTEAEDDARRSVEKRP